MKKLYAKPMIEIESYVLSDAIAAGCGKTVNLGPQGLTIDACSDFEGSFDVKTVNPNAKSIGGTTPFYSDGQADCDCYYSSGGITYLTS